MYRTGVSLFTTIALTGLAAAACDAPPTAPATEQLGVAPAAVVLMDRQEFQFMANIPAPSPCLGGIFQITGAITGWFQDVLTPTGRGHTIEHLDFSGLTATFDGRTWEAQPGSVEIWSIHISPIGDGASVVVHEGRTRFLPDDASDPDIMFVHRIHQLRLPSGEIQLNEISGEAFCVGPDA